MKVFFNSIAGTLAAVFLLTTSLMADSLAGRVLDPDQRAVPNARVRLFDRTTGEMRSTVATANGNYSFQNIPSGNYLLAGDAASSALSGSASLTVSGSQTQDLNLALSGTSSSVTVTTANSAVSVEESAKAIDVVDSRDIALRNELSVGEAVRTLPGVRVQILEGPGSFTTIQTRGLRAQDTAVLIDGMRFRDAGAPQGDASGFLGDMALVDPERIEFLRGSGSSLYGSHALAGALNVSSRTGGGPTHGQLRVEGGGLGMARGVATLTGGLASDRFTYSGGGTHLYVTHGVRNGLPYRNNSVQGSAGFRIKPQLMVTGRMWYSNNYSTSTENPTLTPAILANSASSGEVRAIALPIDQLELYEQGQPFNAGTATFIPNAINPDGRRRSRFLNGALTLQHRVGPNTSYRVGYQAVDTERSTLDGPLGPGFFFSPRSNFNGYIDTIQGRVDQNAGRHHVISFGYELENERYFNYDGPDQTSSSANMIDLRQRSHALYVQDQINLLNRRLQITVAGRTQLFDLKDPLFQGLSNPYSSVISTIDVPTAYTGDAAVAYFFADSRTKLRAHAGNSFRAPASYERFGGGFGSYYGDPRLAPEKAVAVDGGIDQWLLDSRLEVNATWYYTDLQQRVIFENGFAPGTDPFNRSFGGYANGSGGIARGFEVSGRFSPRASTKLQTAYTFTNSDSDTPTIPGTNHHEVLGQSRHILSVTATQWIRNRTNVTFDMSAYSDYTMQIFGGGARQFRFNGPVKADIMVRHDLPFRDDHTVEVYGKVENMFNQRRHEDGFIGPKAWFITGVRINY